GESYRRHWPMATIEKYQTKSGATLYRVRYRTPDNRSTQKRGFTTKRDAEQWAHRVEVAKMVGDYVAPTAGKVTVGGLGPAWLARQRGHLKASTMRSYELSWTTHVAFGGTLFPSPASVSATCRAGYRTCRRGAAPA